MVNIQIVFIIVQLRKNIDSLTDIEINTWESIKNDNDDDNNNTNTNKNGVAKTPLVLSQQRRQRHTQNLNHIPTIIIYTVK